MKKFPQTLINVRVRDKRPWAGEPAIAAAVAQVEDRLAGRFRPFWPNAR